MLLFGLIHTLFYLFQYVLLKDSYISKMVLKYVPKEIPANASSSESPEEPQNALTKKFTQDEWVALRDFRVWALLVDGLLTCKVYEMQVNLTRFIRRSLSGQRER